MRLIHSADWQLGARFAQFGAKAEMLRQARLTALRTALEQGRERHVDAFLIAGDLFEDNQVAEILVETVLDLFHQFSSVPIFICPGNHDPLTGPDAIWRRRSFSRLPSNIVVFDGPKVLDLHGAALIASPLHQKVSTIDPSVRIGDLARTVASDALKIGVTHGALAIPGKHQPNDFPIALDAATRAGIDYLGIGHWHNWQVYDQGRLVMPGTPEPDSFDQSESGSVAFVELERTGIEPKVEKLRVATLAWKTLEFNFLNLDHSRLVFQESLSELRPRADRTVLRIALTGSAPSSVLEETRQWLKQETADFVIVQHVDRASTAFSEKELEELQHEHPLIAEVIGDLAQLERLMTGASTQAVGDRPGIPFSEVQRLTSEARIDAASLKADHFNLARQILFQKLREAQA